MSLLKDKTRLYTELILRCNEINSSQLNYGSNYICYIILYNLVHLLEKIEIDEKSPPAGEIDAVAPELLSSLIKQLPKIRLTTNKSRKIVFLIGRTKFLVITRTKLSGDKILTKQNHYEINTSKN